LKRKTFKVAVHLFLISSENILLLKRYNTGYEDGNYSVIAGHLDGGESVYEAMIREAKEEAGINIEMKNIKIVQVMHRKKIDEERIDYFFESKKWTGKEINREQNKCSELKWCPMNKLPKNTIEYINFAIENYQLKRKFTIFGWD